VKKNRKDWIKIIAICIVIIQTIIIFGLLGFEQTTTSCPETMPKDFNFIASIESDSYIIDTYKGTCTKTIDWEKDTTITLCLTREEKELIYKTISMINIYSYPENYAPISTISVSPTFAFSIKMTMEGIERSINWTENTESETKDAKRLRRLFEKIAEQLENHKEIKELPEDERVFF